MTHPRFSGRSSSLTQFAPRSIGLIETHELEVGVLTISHSLLSQLHCDESARCAVQAERKDKLVSNRSHSTTEQKRSGKVVGDSQRKHSSRSTTAIALSAGVRARRGGRTYEAG